VSDHHYPNRYQSWGETHETNRQIRLQRIGDFNRSKELMRPTESHPNDAIESTINLPILAGGLGAITPASCRRAALAATAFATVVANAAACMPVGMGDQYSFPSRGPMP
jgi:hypothetical protein